MWLFKSHLGLAYYCLGRLDEAEAVLREAVGHMDKVGDWFGAFSHHILRHIYTVRGDIPRELVEAEAEITIGTLCGDLDIVAWGQYGKADALARAGRVGEAQGLSARAVESLNAHGSWAVSIAYYVLGFARLQASDYTGARAALEQSRSSVKQTLSLIEFVADVYPMLVESLLGPRWADAEGGPSRSAARKAWRESRFARFIGWRYRNYGPHALRVSGRAAFALGKTRKAARYLERAIAAAQKLGRPLRPRSCPARRLARHPREGRRLSPPGPGVARRTRRRRPRGRASALYRLREPVIRTSQRTREGARRLLHEYTRSKNGANTSRRGFAATRAIRRPHSSVVNLRIVLAILGSFSRVPGL